MGLAAAGPAGLQSIVLAAAGGGGGAYTGAKTAWSPSLTTGASSAAPRAQVATSGYLSGHRATQ
ncbi:hypothetical protein Tco_0326180, partial [Tanacetum coccineum]